MSISKSIYSNIDLSHNNAFHNITLARLYPQFKKILDF